MQVKSRLVQGRNMGMGRISRTRKHSEHVPIDPRTGQKNTHVYNARKARYAKNIDKEEINKRLGI